MRVLLRNTFITGLVVLVPIVLTAKALQLVFTSIDGLAQPLAVAIVGRTIPGLGFATTLGLVLGIGALFSARPLRRVLEAIETLVDAVPLVGTVYGTTKKVLEGFGSSGAGVFKRFVFARLPGRTTPGFVTGTFTFRRRDDTVFTLCTVYIPTNHLYVGDVVIVPVEDVIETDLSVEDGASLILSAGASVPPVVTES
jgi:uncharacterized membrane protein